MSKERITVNNIIVELEESYDNEVTLNNGESFIVNSTIESVEHIKRVAKVITAPSFTPIQPGDEVVVHHNIFRGRNGIKGQLLESNYDIGNNEYIIPLTEVFMYKRSKDWICLDPFIFIKPIENKEESTSGFTLLEEDSTHKGKTKNQGVIAFINPTLKSKGLNVGDTIVFSDWSEYEFTIEGELYYKMSTKDILAGI